ncbi:response regulator, partial [Paenibacillus sp. GbtcB18]|uniref:response regulator n=1 Tax=Paenibacillus sp. GbtcB18 TaxID=2824763 RepID=UPI001C3053E7
HLKPVGFEVQCVYDGEAVFDVLGPFPPGIIVLDLMLPKMDGPQVCRKLRSQNNLVPIIMPTAKQDLTDKNAGLDNG